MGKAPQLYSSSISFTNSEIFFSSLLHLLNETIEGEKIMKTHNLKIPIETGFKIKQIKKKICLSPIHERPFLPVKTACSIFSEVMKVLNSKFVTLALIEFLISVVRFVLQHPSNIR